MDMMQSCGCGTMRCKLPQPISVGYANMQAQVMHQDNSASGRALSQLPWAKTR
jgi:hypothetical protein